MLYENGADQPATGYNWYQLESTYAFYIDLFEYWAYYSLDYDGGTTRDLSLAKESWNLIYGTDYDAFAVYVNESFDDQLAVWDDSQRFRSVGFDPNHYEPPDGNGLYDNYDLVVDHSINQTPKSNPYQFGPINLAGGVTTSVWNPVNLFTFPVQVSLKAAKIVANTDPVLQGTGIPQLVSKLKKRFKWW